VNENCTDELNNDDEDDKKTIKIGEESERSFLLN
jgi:hypothetical protein